MLWYLVLPKNTSTLNRVGYRHISDFFFRCAPGMAQILGGGSPLCARQGEALAERQDYICEDMVGGSRRQNIGLTNRNHIVRHCHWMRRHLSLKSNTCAEGDDVDVAGISVKVFAHYPGRSVGKWNIWEAYPRGYRLMPQAEWRRKVEPAEVSRGHSSIATVSAKGRT